MPGGHRNAGRRPVWTEEMRDRAAARRARSHAIARGDMIADAAEFDIAESTTCVDCTAVVFPTLSERGRIRCSLHRAQYVIEAIETRQRLAAD